MTTNSSVGGASLGGRTGPEGTGAGKATGEFNAGAAGSIWRRRRFPGAAEPAAYGNAFLAESWQRPQPRCLRPRAASKQARKGDPRPSLAAFRSTKFAPLKELRWGDDTRGLFDVNDADSGTLTIDLHVAYVFKDGDPSKFPYFDPKEFVVGQGEKKFKSSTPSKPKKPGVASSSSSVRGWDEMVVKTTRGYQKTTSRRTTSSASKYPDDAGWVQSYMFQASRKATAAVPGTVTVDSNDLQVSRKQAHHEFFTAYFDEGSAKLDSTAKEEVAGAVDQLDKPKKGFVDVTARWSKATWHTRAWKRRASNWLESASMRSPER